MTSDHSRKSVRQKNRQPAPAKTTPRITAERIQIPSYIPVVAFLLFALGFAWFWVNPVLHYHARMPLFFSGAPFFTEMISKPGGILRYVCNFLEHLYATPWVGALLMTAVLGAVWAVGHALVRREGAKAGSFPLAAGALLVLQTRYNFPWLETALGIVLAAGGGRFYLSIPLRTAAARLAAFSVLSIFLNSVAGPIPSGLFLLIAVAGEWLGGCGRTKPVAEEALVLCTPRRNLAVGVLLAGLIIGAGATQFYRPFELLLPWKTPSDQASMAAVYLCVAAPFLYVGLRRRSAVLGAPGRVGFYDTSSFQWAVLGASIAAAFWLSNASHKATLEVDYHAQREEWAQALQAVPKLKEFDCPTRVNINRALYHQGRMLESLFEYWHRVDHPLLPGPERGLDACRASSAVLLELGQVNLAEHLAHEALEVEGEKPCILKLLFKIEMVKGRSQAARTFLGLLRKDPFYRSWAENYLARMNEDPMLLKDEELARLRAVRVETDFPGESLPADAVLLQCLDKNPKNRMAFEYLMAHYLLSIKPEGVTRNLGRLADVGIPNLPSLLQEAILAHRQVVLQETRQLPAINLHGHCIEPSNEQRFDRFIAIMSGADGDVKKCQPALAREMGSSYFYYSVYTETAFKPGEKFSSL